LWPQLKPQQAWRLFYHHFIVALKTFKQWDYLASAVKRVPLNKVRLIATTILPIFHLLVLVFYELKDLWLWAWELRIYKTHGMILLHVSALASKPLCTHKILLNARQWTMIASRFGWKKVLKILCFRLDTLLKMIHFTSDIWTIMVWFFAMPVSYFTVAYLNSSLAQTFQCWYFGCPSESLQELCRWFLQISLY
jgi:hypothetical protein